MMSSGRPLKRVSEYKKNRNRNSLRVSSGYRPLLGVVCSLAQLCPTVPITTYNTLSVKVPPPCAHSELVSWLGLSRPQCLFSALGMFRVLLGGINYHMVAKVEYNVNKQRADFAFAKRKPMLSYCTSGRSSRSQMKMGILMTCVRANHSGDCQIYHSRMCIGFDRRAC